MTNDRRVAPGAGALRLGALLLILGVSPAGAQVYRCDSAGGVPVYQGTASGTNCRPVDLAPLTMIPAPPRAATAPAAAKSPAAGAPAPGASTSTSPAAARGFPAVAPAAQRARDDDRRQILEEELRKEQERLEALRSRRNQITSAAPVDAPATPAGGSGPSAADAADPAARPADAPTGNDGAESARLDLDIERSQGNIATLQRELEAAGATRSR